MGIPPIGCVPSQRTLGGGILRACADPQNQLAWLFNTRMDAEMTRLKQRNPRTLLVFGDIYGILYDMIENPYNYGKSQSPTLFSLIKKRYSELEIMS